MTESIFNSLKKAGADLYEEYDNFDDQLFLYINSLFPILRQLGVGKPGFAITDDTATWDEFLDDQEYITCVKTWMAMKLKIQFDPPANSVVLDAYNKTCQELEFRMMSMAEVGL